MKTPSLFGRMLRLFFRITLIALSSQTIQADSANKYEGDWISPSVLFRGLQIKRAERGYIVSYVNHGNGMEYAPTEGYSVGGGEDVFGAFASNVISSYDRRNEAIKRITYIAGNDSLQLTGFDFKKNSESGNMMEAFIKAATFNMNGVSDRVIVMQRLNKSLKEKATAEWDKFFAAETVRIAEEEKIKNARLVEQKKIEAQRQSDERKAWIRNIVAAAVASPSSNLDQILIQITPEEHIQMIRSAKKSDLLVLNRDEIRTITNGLNQTPERNAPKNAIGPRDVLAEMIGETAITYALMPVDEFRQKARSPGFIANIKPSDITYSVAVEIATRFFDQVPRDSALEKVFFPESPIGKRMVKNQTRSEESRAIKIIARRYDGG